MNTLCILAGTMIGGYGGWFVGDALGRGALKGRMRRRGVHEAAVAVEEARLDHRDGERPAVDDELGAPGDGPLDLDSRAGGDAR